ncbi:MAG: VOC family protein [Bacillota bacterium]
MKIVHVGLTCSSEEKADRFYGSLLGLEKKEPKTVPADTASVIFSIDADLKVINYTGAGVCFEVFLSEKNLTNRPIDHICIEVENLEAFVDQCREEGVKVTRVPRGKSLVTFIEDFDSNLFEVKGD